MNFRFNNNTQYVGNVPVSFVLYLFVIIFENCIKYKLFPQAFLHPV